MSCATSKTEATAKFTAGSYNPSSELIQVLEQTNSLGVVQIKTVRGKIEVDLTPFSTGTADVYLKVGTQPDGSSNSPPVTPDNLFHIALSATVGIVNTSAYYADITPTFSASNNCTVATDLGWIINDQITDIKPVFVYTP